MKEHLKNYGIFIPIGPTQTKVPRTVFGWACCKMKRWVGIKKYKRITPVRSDMIFDFLFWRFVKSLNTKQTTWKH